MSSPYNRFAGQSLDPLRALSDGVFAVAMTLLVLDLRVPLGVAHSNHELWHALSGLGPRLAAYVLSFTMLGIFWLAQNDCKYRVGDPGLEPGTSSLSEKRSNRLS